MHSENLAMPFFTKIIMTLLICAGHLSMKISNQTSWQPRKSQVTQLSVYIDGSLSPDFDRCWTHAFSTPLIKAPVITTHLKNHFLDDLLFLHTICSTKNWNQ